MFSSFSFPEYWREYYPKYFFIFFFSSFPKVYFRFLNTMDIIDLSALLLEDDIKEVVHENCPYRSDLPFLAACHKRERLQFGCGYVPEIALKLNTTLQKT